MNPEICVHQSEAAPLNPVMEGSRDAQEALRQAAAAHQVQALLAQRWEQTQRRDRRAVTSGVARRVHYLSMEFLMGRALGNALAALGLEPGLRQQLQTQGLQLSQVLELENDAALGNGFRMGASWRCRMTG
jgi:starch phosphorylase